MFLGLGKEQWDCLKEGDVEEKSQMMFWTGE